MAASGTLRDAKRVDAVLIGGGVASATLATLLHHLEPSWHIVVLEKLDKVGLESSDGWNNAGTGHSALCELNYTPQSKDGSVSITKAISINEQFQVSRQLWASLVERGVLASPSSFIRPVPHMSFVRGSENVEFLKKRAEALSAHPLFESIEFSTSRADLESWAPLIMRGRDHTEKVAATRSMEGTDVDFGSLTRALFEAADPSKVEVLTSRTVVDLKRLGSEWGVMASTNGSVDVYRAPFVFVGAGGAALPLLQRSEIAEIRGFGGFPISGQWLRCTNPEIIAQHEAKVYGKAAVGAPPMSVPHLDTRVINGQRALMFGPYAGWTPKFLKQGSNLDLFRSIKPGNIAQMLAVAPPNLDLMTYLVSELTKTRAQRVEALREYMPTARDEDWELVTAGQRVQVIAPDSSKIGTLQFGTQLVTAKDGSIGGMLGASPGASTAASIMLALLETMFPSKIEAWRPALADLIPSYGKSLAKDEQLARHTLASTADTLGLN